MATMSDERLAEMRERRNKATAGPWVAEHRAVDRTADDDECSGGLGLEVVGPPRPMLRGTYARAADAAFITSAREDVPYLLDEVERLQKDIDSGEDCWVELVARYNALLARNAELLGVLRRWVEWLPGSVWECSRCGYIAIPSPEDWSEFTRTLLADTLKALEEAE